MKIIVQNGIYKYVKLVYLGTDKCAQSKHLVKQ